MAKKEDVASNFKADDVYMPGLNDPDAIKNAPKEAPKKVV